MVTLMSEILLQLVERHVQSQFYNNFIYVAVAARHMRLKSLNVPGKSSRTEGNHCETFKPITLRA